MPGTRLQLAGAIITALMAAMIAPGGAPPARAQDSSLSGNVLRVQVVPGVVRIESLRLACLPCLSRAASAVEALPGVAEVGRVPDSFPPAVIVRFDPAQVSVEMVLQAFRTGLEADPLSPGPVTVTFVPGEVRVPPTLEPIERVSDPCPIC
jgi:hypothetical protein